jgi:hypothetical protein
VETYRFLNREKPSPLRENRTERERVREKVRVRERHTKRERVYVCLLRVSLYCLLQIIGLFCKRALINETIFCKRDLYIESASILSPLN